MDAVYAILAAILLLIIFLKIIFSKKTSLKKSVAGKPMGKVKNKKEEFINFFNVLL